MTSVRAAAPGQALSDQRWHPRKSTTRRTVGNRVLWTVVGLILLAGGLLTALASKGIFGNDASTPVIPPSFVARWHSWHGWAYAVAIAAALIVALLGYLLLRAELHGRGGAVLADRAVEPTSAPPGRTFISTSGLSQALTRDLQTHPTVRRASVHLTGSARKPQVYLRLTVTPEADLAEVRRHVDASLDRFATTTGWRPALAEVTVNLAKAAPQRVR